MRNNKKFKPKCCTTIQLFTCCIGFCCVWIFLGGYGTVATRFEEDLNLPNKLPSVPRIPWPRNADSDFIQSVIDKGEPVIFYNSSLEKNWPAFKKWSNEYFLSILGKEHILREVWYSSKPTIYRDKSRFDWPGQISNYESIDMTLHDFIEKISQKNPNEFYHFSESVEDFDERFMKDINSSDLAPRIQQGKTSNLLWMGTPSVTSQCHYDLSENFYVQLKGHKRFILTPPDSLKFLKPFPYSHPLGRRSQRNFTDLLLYHRDELLAAHAREAYLQRGDILFIPTFWFHHVTNIDGSLSVNVWTRRKLQDAIEKNVEIQEFPVYHPEEKLLLVKKTVENILRKLNHEPSKYIKEHWELRYKDIFETQFNGRESIIMKTFCSRIQTKTLVDKKFMDKSSETFFENFRLVLAKLQEIHVGDWIDNLAYSNMKAPEQMYFFRYCFPENSGY